MQFIAPLYNFLAISSFFVGLWFWDIREGKTCSKCNAAVLAKSKFCPKCGNKL